jgi:GT2 family glycosyltransferase
MTDSYVGMLLITYNDAENLEAMFRSLECYTDYPMFLHIIDMGSTDATLKIIADWIELQTNENIYGASIEKRDKLDSLTSTMNAGFKYLMGRQECEYIGWIHPDMKFEERWLSELVEALKRNPNFGKVCSFNTRYGQPNTMDYILGQEQAYIIRRGILLRIGLFCEDYIGIGGYEDWDLNNRISKEGFAVVISPFSHVNHAGMQTRSRRDTTQEQIHNSGVYQRRWGTHKERIEFR